LVFLYYKKFLLKINLEFTLEENDKVFLRGSESDEKNVHQERIKNKLSCFYTSVNF